MTPAIISAAVGLGKQFLGMEAEEQKRDDELELSVVQATGQVARIICIVYLFGPDFAAALPWIEPADVAQYQQAMAEATPAWKQGAKEGVVFAMWGLTERNNHKAKAARTEKAKRRDGPPGGGP
jgi:hypothetical protein